MAPQQPNNPHPADKPQLALRPELASESQAARKSRPALRPELASEAQPVRKLRTVALIGVDGSGKTTQAHRLAGELAAQGLPAVYRRNAGGRRWFTRLAGTLGRRDADALLGRHRMLVVESVLRWLAILRTLLRRTVTRELTVMDRYAFCQYASLRARSAQVFGSSAAERRARLAYRLFPRPDVTFLLTVDPAVAYDRIEARGYDHEEMAYLHAASAAYRSLPEHEHFVTVDANGTPDQVSATLHAELTAWQRRPAPFTEPVLARILAGARTAALVGSPLAAGATAIGLHLAEAF
jgi:dTMP kinase